MRPIIPQHQLLAAQNCFEHQFGQPSIEGQRIGAQGFRDGRWFAG